MTDFFPEVFEVVIQPGPRLPWLADWMLQKVWTKERYQSLGPVEFLQQGEKQVNQIEEVIASAATRVYDEFLSPVPRDRDVQAFFTSTAAAAVVIFDGLSLREVPLLLDLAEQSRLPIKTTSYSIAAVPSETLAFIEDRLKVSNTSPSQLPHRRELKSQGIQAYYFAHTNERHQLDLDAKALLLWSSFPDQTYADSGARFAHHFEQIHKMLETAWQNTVQQIPKGRKILITSDHGYVYFGAGLDFNRDRASLRPLSDFLGGERHCVFTAQQNPPGHPDLLILEGRKLAILRGRVKPHFQGPASNKLYRHGGLSLMEMLTPWVVIES